VIRRLLLFTYFWQVFGRSILRAIKYFGSIQIKPGAMPQALLMSPRWGLKIVTLGYEKFLKNILNVGITWIAW